MAFNPLTSAIPVQCSINRAISGQLGADHNESIFGNVLSESEDVR